MLTLEVTSGPATGQSVDVTDEIVIGREDAGLVIDDPEISRRHARVSPVDGGVVVEDLGSTNGTFVNGERASEPVTLKESGTIRVGTTSLAVNIPIVPIAEGRRACARSRTSTPTSRGARPIASDVTAPRAVAPAQPRRTPPRPRRRPAPPPPPAAAPAAAGRPAARSDRDRRRRRRGDRGRGGPRDPLDPRSYTGPLARERRSGGTFSGQQGQDLQLRNRDARDGGAGARAGACSRRAAVVLARPEARLLDQAVHRRQGADGALARVGARPQAPSATRASSASPTR